VAKKFKNGFVQKLKEDGQVVEERKVDLDDSKLIPAGKQVKLLFYGTNEDESLHMLIGLAKILSENDSIDIDS
jgi:hypothetical protein